MRTRQQPWFQNILSSDYYGQDYIQHNSRYDHGHRAISWVQNIRSPEYGQDYEQQIDTHDYGGQRRLKMDYYDTTSTLRRLEWPRPNTIRDDFLARPSMIESEEQRPIQEWPIHKPLGEMVKV